MSILKRTGSLVLTAGVLLLLAACGKGEKETENFLNLSSEKISASDAAGSQSITVTSSADWQTICSTTWCTVTPSEGRAGKTEVTVSFEKNTAKAARTAVVTFLSATQKGKLTLNQAGTSTDPDDGDGDGDGDEDGDTHEDAKANRWVYEQLCEWYLYNTELKGAKPADFNKDCDVFLSDMLLGLKTNTLDGGTYYDGEKYIYSYIERYDNSTRAYSFDPTYGFDFMFDYVDDYSADLYARVLFVLPDSPAQKAGLKRGDKILKANGTTLTLYNYEDLMYDYMLYPASGATLKVSLSGGKTLSMTSAEIPFTPIVCHKTLDRSGKKVGYLMFNAFESGYAADGSSYEYEDQLEDIFSTFKSEGIRELVLDLRYNGGGYLSTAQLLGSLITPADKLGSVMAKLIYNDDITNNYSEEYLGSPIRFNSAMAGKTVGLQKIYVLATDMSASASEEIINALRGIDVQVIHIGTTTEGKNVGMDYFGETFGAYYYEMWPVTFISANAKGFYQYENGFDPQYEYDEWVDDTWYELGDEREVLLSMALDLIDGKTPKQQTVTRAASARRLAGQKPHARVSGLRNNLK